MNSLQGHLLIASPYLPDPNFARSIVLMIQHNDQGAMGLVLNRPSDNRLPEIWKQVSDEPCRADQPLFVGGPVPGPLMAIHKRRSCSDEEVKPGIYFATDREHVMELVRRNAQPFHVYSGYAGWGEGQLENEMEAGGWLTCPATDDLVFPEPGEDVWKKAVHQVGSDILRSSLDLDEPPDDLSMN